jgi:membrane-bound lytic murein transglycosylase B
MVKLGLMMKCPLATLLLVLLIAAPAAAQCGGDFSVFLSAKAREAQAAGLPRGIIEQAFASVTIDPAVLAFDRRQHGTFRMSFERYAATRVTEARLRRARVLMARHAALLARVERQFGVPARLLMATTAPATWAACL